MQVGLVNVTSAMCRHQQDMINIQCSALVLNLNNIFKWVFVPGCTIKEFPAFANAHKLCASLAEIKL
jgi:hypothetical protein